MIKLSNILHETKNETGFVLVGGKRTTGALEAASHLDDVNRLIRRLEAAIAERKTRGTVVKTKKGVVITRKKSDNNRYFLGV